MTNAIVINTELSDPQSAVRISNPYLHVVYPDTGRPVAGGYMYFGSPSTDPTDPEFQKRVYLIQEDGTAVPIAQPVELSAGGVPLYNGSPAVLAVDGDYSWTVLDASLATVYTNPKTSNPNLSSSSATIIEDFETLTASQQYVTFDNVDLTMAVIDIKGADDGTDDEINGRSLYKDIDYTIVDGAAGQIYLINGFETGAILRARQNAFSSQTSSSISAYPYAYDTIADAKAADLPAGTKTVIAGGSSEGDGLTFPLYTVVAGGTGVNDGVNFINMANGNQLKSLGNRVKFSSYSEKVNSLTVASGSLTIDLESGTVHSVTLDQSVTSLNFANVQSSRASSVTLYVTQDGTGGYGIDFAGLRAAGGTAPTVSSGANEQTDLVFTTQDGATWSVYVAGLDMSIIP